MNDRPESLEQIESMIAAAKDYVTPSENLRPRVLEAARAQQGYRLSLNRLLQIAAAVFLTVILSIPIQQRLDAWRSAALSPSADEFERRAQQLAGQPTIGPNWGFYEAYESLRADRHLKLFGQ